MNHRHLVQIAALTMLTACKSSSPQEPAQTGTTSGSTQSGSMQGSGTGGSTGSTTGSSDMGSGSSMGGSGSGSGSTMGGSMGSGSMGSGSGGSTMGTGNTGSTGGSMAGGSMGGSMGSGSGQAGSAMTDAEITAVVQTVNQGEMDLAQLATKKAKDASVKSFAQMMTTHHGQAHTKAATVARGANITPSPNSTATKLSTDAASTMSSLQGKTGTEFDREYMTSQVKMHRDVLMMIDQQLMTAARSPELKAHLGELRGNISTHLTKAEEIQSKLGTTTR